MAPNILRTFREVLVRIRHYRFPAVRESLFILVPTLLVISGFTIYRVDKARRAAITTINRKEESKLKTDKGLLVNKLRSASTDLDVISDIIMKNLHGTNVRREIHSDLNSLIERKPYFKSLIVSLPSRY